MKDSEMDVLSHPFLFKRMQTCLQRFIYNEGGAKTAKLKLFKTVQNLLIVICNSS